MAVPSASVVDGELQYDYTDSSKKAKELKGSNLGYDQFLQLLCAEMQYQDPLEPASNTDYVAQLATFSQLEATLSLENTQTSSMANALVGKTVILKTTNETTGATRYVDGRVDYVMYKEGEAFLSVNNSLYPITDLDTVADDSYYEAMGLAKSIENMLGQLPAVENINAGYETLINQIFEIYDGMDSYQKGFVKEDTVKLLNSYKEKLNEELEREAAKKEEEVSEEEADGVEETDSVSEA